MRYYHHVIMCVLPCVCLRIYNNIFLGYGTCKPDPSAVNNIDYKLALKTMENELASLFEVFFTGNSFFHYYQAKTSIVGTGFIHWDMFCWGSNCDSSWENEDD
jgi:hypothetical protein